MGISAGIFGALIIIFFILTIVPLMIKLLRLEDELDFDPRFGRHDPRKTPLGQATERLLNEASDNRLGGIDPRNSIMRNVVDQLKESHEPRYITKDYDPRFLMHDSSKSALRDAMKILRSEEND